MAKIASVWKGNVACLDASFIARNPGNALEAIKSGKTVIHKDNFRELASPSNPVMPGLWKEPEKGTQKHKEWAVVQEVLAKINPENIIMEDPAESNLTWKKINALQPLLSKTYAFEKIIDALGKPGFTVALLKLGAENAFQAIAARQQRIIAEDFRQRCKSVKAFKIIPDVEAVERFTAGFLKIAKAMLARAQEILLQNNGVDKARTMLARDFKNETLRDMKLLYYALESEKVLKADVEILTLDKDIEEMLCLLRLTV